MTVVFDENVSHKLVELLAKRGAPGDLQHVRKLKWNGLPDLVWMPRAVKAGFAIVSADRSDRTRGPSANDLKALSATVVLLAPFWDNLGIWDKTKWLVGRWDWLHATISGMPGGSCVVVGQHLQVSAL